MGMRFFFFNGKSAEGPFDVGELVKRPDFTSESLVAPVGASAVDDWKPAISYEILKERLLAPSAPPPRPEPPDPMKPCPKCSQTIPEVSGYCHRCGEAVSPGTIEARKAPAAPGPWTLPKGRKALTLVVLASGLGLISGLFIPYGPAKNISPEKSAATARLPVEKPRETSPKPAMKSAPVSVEPRKKRGPPPPLSRRKYKPKSQTAVRPAKKHAKKSPDDMALMLPGVGKKVKPLEAKPKASSREPETAADKIQAESALEEFKFCTQRLKNGELEDVFDYCLCTAVKHGPPLFGNRDTFVSETKKSLEKEGPDSRYEVVSTLVRGSDVMISAVWTYATPEGGLIQEHKTERWVFEDGRWCVSR